MRRSAASALILLVAAAWWCSAAVGADLKVGDQAPVFFLSTYNPERCGTKRVSIDRLVGEQAQPPKKLLLLSFFNIDCKPCRKEMPYLQKLYDRYRNEGLQVLVVNCDYRKEKIEEVVKFIEEFGFTFPVLKDNFSVLQRRYGAESFPTMFILDSQGIIQDIRVGYDPEKMPFPLATVQRRLLVPVEPIDGQPGSSR